MSAMPVLMPVRLARRGQTLSHHLQPRPRPAHHPPAARPFFSLPNILPSAPTPPKSHQQRHILPYSPHQLYEIVADVDKYSEFVPWCNNSTVLSSRESGEGKVMRAELGVGFGAMSERYTSLVECQTGRSVTVSSGLLGEEGLRSSHRQLLLALLQATAQKSTLFKHLVTTWNFSPVRPAPPSNTTGGGTSPYDTSPCAVDFSISFQFANPLYAQLSNVFFTEVSKSMVGAFEKRAAEVYGPAGGSGRIVNGRETGLG
ncbi:dehydrase and lipid transport-domain-containing protein [Fimicolochytrium jonesii]|uniref:dehydrase and lipid transport-domain-containing protein n=1 Tax=Fimicolochytrium jonesii TaxID=1396493 RepID=UPI0022FDE11D|nr:dehydrase and lipid transport-domain-containing protein [Fimicolochytrium jonesii]KAI8819579.1 dehydrase and lipid transport-domain-containing protein [Fimicolochytrium jonesii]